ncbi:TPA: hypothetical protein NU460_000001 [Escherichia coli]|nr:hypothetical protein [Escherichia coli]
MTEAEILGLIRRVAGISQQVDEQATQPDTAPAKTTDSCFSSARVRTPRGLIRRLVESVGSMTNRPRSRTPPAEGIMIFVIPLAKRESSLR